MRRRRIIRKTMGKEPIKHSNTIVGNIGNATVNPIVLSLRESTVGARSTTGSVQTIRTSANTDSLCQVGDICKYINITIQASPRVSGAANAGWIEWAIVSQTGTWAWPSNTNLGTQTFADVCTKQFRGDCLYTGAIPLGTVQPVVQDVRFKLPPKIIKQLIGGYLHLFAIFRSSSSTDTQTDSTRVVMSCLYKNYS